MWRKIRLIARREYLYNFKRRQFLFTAFGVPVFIFIIWIIMFSSIDESVEATGTLGDIGYVDLAGFLDDPVEQPEEYLPFSSAEAAHEALLADEIGAYFVVAEDYLTSGAVDAFAFQGIPDGIENQLEAFVEANVVRLAPPELPIDRLLHPMDVRLVETGTGGEIDGEDAIMGRFLSPMIFAIIFLMAVNTTSQFLMSSVVEEKENRMMEILVTSSRPLEMLWGKVLGMGALGLTQVAFWGVAGSVVMNLGAENNFIASLTFTPDFLVIGLVCFVLGYFMYSAIMAGVGAAVTAEQEGRQFAGILSLVAVLPMMLAVVFITDANGVLPVALTLIPFTAPLTLIMRWPLAPVPAWQVIASIVLMVLAIFAVVWVSARVFRLGMLMYGKRLSMREIINALRQGRRVMTSVAGEEA